MNKKIKIVYCLPSLYIPGGMERVLTIKANYFAEKLGYDIYIILTDGKGLEPFYALSPKVHLIHLDINFNELWNKPLYKKLFIYACKQRLYKKRLTKCLFEIRPDITVSMLRREINFPRRQRENRRNPCQQVEFQRSCRSQKYRIHQKQTFQTLDEAVGSASKTIV